MGLNPALGLAGTTPFHNYYVMLHSRDRPREFPKVASSPVQKELQLALAPSNGLVNFSWSPQQSLPPLSSSFDEEVYSATAFSKAGSVIELEGLSLSNVQEAVRQITSPHHTIRHTDVARQLYIYVCTHAARDCRCGDTGGLVAAAFRKEIDRRGLTSAVKLGETGHVGGHKLRISTFGFSHKAQLNPSQVCRKRADIPGRRMVSLEASHSVSDIHSSKVRIRKNRGRSKYTGQSSGGL